MLPFVFELQGMAFRETVRLKIRENENHRSDPLEPINRERGGRRSVNLIFSPDGTGLKNGVVSDQDHVKHGAAEGFKLIQLQIKYPSALSKCLVSLLTNPPNSRQARTPKYFS